jgi:probable rRNA maturation factor
VLHGKNRLTVELANQQRLRRLGTTRIRAVLRRALRLEGVKQGHVEVAFVDDKTIRRVHRRYLKLDTATDVLTFPLNDSGESLAGLIVVSVQTAIREAPLHGQTIEREILLYAIHGILHLCGYDDHTPQMAWRMGRRQRELLRQATV